MNVSKKFTKFQNITERLFAKRVTLLTDIKTPVIKRNPYGVLSFTWDCSCKEIEDMCVFITPKEITLSCKIAHIHFASSKHSEENLTNLKKKHQIVDNSIQFAYQFLQGEIAAVISYDENEKKHSYGFCKTNELSSSLKYYQQVFGSGMTQRAWIWTGEII